MSDSTPNTAIHLMSGQRIDVRLTHDELLDLLTREDSYLHVERPGYRMIIPVAQVSFIAQEN